MEMPEATASEFPRWTHRPSTQLFEQAMATKAEK